MTNSSLARGVERTVWQERIPLIDRIPQWISVLMIFLFAIGVWHVITASALVSRLILPSPREGFADIVIVLSNVLSGDYLLPAFGTTVSQILLGFFFAVLSGIALGILVGETRFGERAVMPYLIAINVMPKIAFAPIFIAWLGFGMSSKIVLATFFAVFPVVIATAAGLHAADANARLMFKAIGATRIQTLFLLKLPSALPMFFVGLKNAAVMVTVGAIVGEFFGGGKGVGEYIRIASANLQTARVFSLIILLSLFGLLLFHLINILQARLIFWQRSNIRYDAHEGLA